MIWPIKSLFVEHSAVIVNVALALFVAIEVVVEESETEKNRADLTGVKVI